MNYAQHFFAINLAEEKAMLVVMEKNPTGFCPLLSPASNLEALENLRRRIQELEEMAKNPNAVRDWWEAIPVEDRGKWINE